jgi:hypothetical protein
MEESQLTYMRKNGLTEVECEGCNKSLIGSIKPYSKHLVICYKNATLWGSHISEEGMYMCKCIYMYKYMCM